MRQFPATPMEMLACIWRNRELIAASAKREVLGRYRGSSFGLLWSFFNPLLMLTVYTFVFSDIFKARWNASSESKTEFALVLFSGLLVFNLFSECINRAPNLITTNPNYVKKVIFPLEVLPFVSLLAALYHALVSIAVWLAAYIVLFGLPHTSMLYLPLIIMPLGFLIMGFSWILASLGVFLRDVSQFVGIATSVLMFLSPVFYPANSLPETYQKLLYLNPLTFAIEMTRNALYWGNPPEASVLAIYWLTASLISWTGFSWFQKTRKGFADVI